MRRLRVLWYRLRGCSRYEAAVLASGPQMFLLTTKERGRYRLYVDGRFVEERIDGEVAA